METFSALLDICAGNSPVNSPHKGQWRGALMFSLISVWINGWVNNREAGELRRYHAHYDVIVMWVPDSLSSPAISSHDIDTRVFGAHQQWFQLRLGWQCQEIMQHVDKHLCFPKKAHHVYALLPYKAVQHIFKFA